MADLLPVIETMEHRWMRAWANRDTRVLKALTSGNFRLVISSKPPAILDAPSWLDAAATRFLCQGYRFGEVYARSFGSIAVFGTRMELQATLDGDDWSGEVWVTDLWRKTRIRRSWRMIERVLSRPEERPQVPAAVRSCSFGAELGVAGTIGEPRANSDSGISSLSGISRLAKFTFTISLAQRCQPLGRMRTFLEPGCSLAIR
jgi:hypothetical protein